MASNNQGTQQDYDFVEQPDQDFYCPVSLEILLKPHQTLCCGQHISQEAANRLTREGQPCPMCKSEDLVTQEDKYFKRKVRQLKVCCPHKKSGCDWMRELGDLNLHSNSCPKRPWKCQHCNFETIYEVGPNDHTPNCTKLPTPCPNRCEIGTVPRCDVEKHLLVCPLQLVECEFAQSGCDAKVPRGDLAKHMTKNALHHLMSTTLLNIRLTRELHQKMEEKDQQIVNLQQQVKDLDTKLSKMVEYTARGFTRHDFTLTNFKKHQTSGINGSWYSDPFYCYPGGYSFKLNIDTSDAVYGTHLSAYLYLLPGVYDKELKWPIKCTVHLEMLNQRGDHGHHIVIGNIKYTKAAASDTNAEQIGLTPRFFPLAELGYNAANNTEYLSNDSLHVQLYLKAELIDV